MRARFLPSSSLFLAVGALASSACAPDEKAAPPAEECEAPDAEHPERFPPCDTGSGAFGRFVVEDGLPAYRYDVDEQRDGRAVWAVSSGDERRDHMFALGNDRVNVVADNDGFAQVFMRDRGPTFLNRRDIDDGRVGGGFSYVKDGDDVWATAKALAPDGAVVDRRFSPVAMKSIAEHGGLRVSRSLTAPPGDAPYVVDDVVIENTSDVAKDITHVEAWDVNHHFLALQILRSGALSADLPGSLDDQRDALNAAFSIDAAADTAVPGAPNNAMRVRHRAHDAIGARPALPDDVDAFPDDIFLAAVLAETRTGARFIDDDDDASGAFITDRAAFFGDVTDAALATPKALVDDAAALAEGERGRVSAASAQGEPALLAHARRVHLERGARVHLRYAFGAVPQDAPLVVDEAMGDDVAAQAAAQMKRALPLVVVPGHPLLHREMAWHAASLEAATAFDRVLGSHMTTQGGVYQYLHGADGASRDWALFSIPLVYLRPDLARENLRTIMRLTHADDFQISYATAGVGQASALVAHTHPSDLDIFFLWALSEYVVATGDRAFLDEQNEYWPAGARPAETVREHARRAVRHLLDDDGVGVGPHGLLRVRTGDWSDGIVFHARNRDDAIANGESVPNTQMAAWVLPLAARAIFFDGDNDDAIADAATREELVDAATRLREAAEQQWTGSFYRRAWFGADEPFEDDVIDLESQIWALIADIPSGVAGGGASDRDALIDAVKTKLDDVSDVGALRAEGADVWPALTDLLTWGYARHRPDLALRELDRHSFASYAQKNPQQWFGIWSAPDGIYPSGGTWSSPATPTPDWPVMNQNAHAMPLIALLRTAGLEPDVDGAGSVAAALAIRPRTLPVPFLVDTPLVRLSVEQCSVDVTYRAQNDGHVSLRFDDDVDAVTVDGAARTLDAAHTLTVDLVRRRDVAIHATRADPGCS